MTDILGGEVVHGPDQRPYLLAAFVGSMWSSVGIDPEERRRLRQQGVKHVSVRQLQDRPMLGVLDLAGHQWRYYEGEEVFAFLQPWLRTLAQCAHAKRPPLYSLVPEDWELRVLAQFGLDKQLPGAAFPGLAPPQLHRVIAMERSLDVKGRTAIQPEEMREELVPIQDVHDQVVEYATARVEFSIPRNARRRVFSALIALA